MIFCDTNVVMYAVGRRHPLQEEVRRRLRGTPSGVLATSAEVLQELLHAYLPVGRKEDLEAAFRLVEDRMTVWPLEPAQVRSARDMAEQYPSLTARDLVHLATCMAHSVDECWTYDRGLAAAYRR